MCLLHKSPPSRGMVEGSIQSPTTEFRNRVGYHQVERQMLGPSSAKIKRGGPQQPLGGPVSIQGLTAGIPRAASPGTQTQLHYEFGAWQDPAHPYPYHNTYLHPNSRPGSVQERGIRHTVTRRLIVSRQRTARRGHPRWGRHHQRHPTSPASSWQVPHSPSSGWA